VFIFIVSVLNVRKPIRFAFVKRAHSQGDFHLRELLYGYGRNSLSIRMYHGIFEVLLELEIRDI
jgi:hypothetical protein